MERRESKSWPGLFAVVLAAGAGLSCGTGIRDGRGEVFTTEIVGPDGAELSLREGALEVWPNCVAAQSTITLRRYDRIEHLGAVSPVFEVQVPTSDTFKNDPGIVIETSADVAESSKSVIGFLIPGSPNEQWIPISSTSSAPCPTGTLCAPVQRLSFSNPGGTNPPTFTTTILQLAIVTRCGSTAECPSRQACNSGACQRCPTGSPCNP